MIPRFSLARPMTLDGAFAAFAAADGDAAYLAGGTEHLQVMKMGLAGFGTLVDLKRIEELKGIGIEDGNVRIGAATTHREIERSDVIGRAVPALVALEGNVANVRVRNQGTIGGNLAFAEPHSDPATFLLACDATVELAAPTGRRTLAVGEFAIGPLATSREPDEIITSIRIPRRRQGEGRGYAKIAFFERPAASVAARVRVEANRIAEATVAVGSLVETPTLVPDAARALVGVPAEEGDGDVDRAVATATDAFSTLDAFPDLNGSVDYKLHLAGLLLRRAVRSAIREATTDA
ncbi:MAG: FAD binding domain-containing protein [Chloroflexota bacterium]